MKTRHKGLFAKWIKSLVLVTGVAVTLAMIPIAKAADPIKIGFSMTLTGGLAPAGQAALVAMKIWQDDVNAVGACWVGRSNLFITMMRQTHPRCLVFMPS